MNAVVDGLRAAVASRCRSCRSSSSGNKLGTLERLVVNREAPKKVSSVDLEVKLDDSLVAQGLAGCRLAANLESDSTQVRRRQYPRRTG